MNNLLHKILTHPQNLKVLEFLNSIQENHFEKWDESLSAFNEGAEIFFNDYGRPVPPQTKFLLGTHGIMINETTGEIFAFHTGRLSVFFKCDFLRTKIENTDSLRKGETLDGITDITELGDGWCFMNKFAEDEQEQLKWSYELTHNKPPITYSP